MRILLATEGPSDEVVAQHLLEHVLGQVTVERKRFPARGFPIVYRLIGEFVRAGHFGHFDLLVLHFDLDNTLPDDFTNVSQSPRWNEIQSRIDETLTKLPTAHRNVELKIALMTPCKATEAWLAWGREDDKGRKWERKDHHTLKRQLFGEPPRRLVEKARVLVSELTNQMEANDDWPATLRWFVDELAKHQHPNPTAENDRSAREGDRE